MGVQLGRENEHGEEKLAPPGKPGTHEPGTSSCRWNRDGYGRWGANNERLSRSASTDSSCCFRARPRRCGGGFVSRSWRREISDSRWWSLSSARSCAGCCCQWRISSLRWSVCSTRPCAGCWWVSSPRRGLSDPGRSVSSASPQSPRPAQRFELERVSALRSGSSNST